MLDVIPDLPLGKRCTWLKSSARPEPEFPLLLPGGGSWLKAVDAELSGCRSPEAAVEKDLGEAEATENSPNSLVSRSCQTRMLSSPSKNLDALRT